MDAPPIAAEAYLVRAVLSRVPGRLRNIASGRIASELKERCPGVPLMVFARGATYANVALQVSV